MKFFLILIPFLIQLQVIANEQSKKTNKAFVFSLPDNNIAKFAKNYDFSRTLTTDNIELINLEAIRERVTGNDGGGGHTCKLQAELYLSYIGSIINNDENLLQKFPEWEKLKSLTNPIKNPDFEIKITGQPIPCKNTANAIACSTPSLNTMEIFCGAGGWNTLPWNEKYMHIIHEAYWWSDIDDANYFYSTKLTMELISKDYISKEVLTNNENKQTNELSEVELNNLISLITEDMQYPLVYKYSESENLKFCKIFFSRNRGITFDGTKFKRKFQYTKVIKTIDLLTGNDQYVFSNTKKARKQKFKGQQQRQELIVTLHSNKVRVLAAEYKILLSQKVEKGLKSNPRLEVGFYNKYKSMNHSKSGKICVGANMGASHYINKR